MEFNCDKCNKTYKSYQSRWNHIKKSHNEQVTQSNHESNHSGNHKGNHGNHGNHSLENKEDKTYDCRKCGKLFDYKQNRWRHEQKCTEIKTNFNNNEVLELKKEIGDLKEMLQKHLKIHPKTLQKINKQLINNGTINNTINIVPLGSENLHQILTDKEKLAILNKKYNSLNELINKVHILPDNRYNQFKNVYITNLQNDIAYEYNNNSKQFQAVDKNELLEKLIDKRMIDIETFALELDEKNNLPPELSELIDKFIEQMWADNSELKIKKIKQVKLLLYNNRDMIKEKVNEEYKIIDL